MTQIVPFLTRGAKQRPFRFVDLFCGVGGFHHALQSLGGECVLACEVDDKCRDVYKKAFPDMPSEAFIRDIRDLTRCGPGELASSRTTAEIAALVPDHDVLCGGFPCQPFSKSGHQKGFRDKTRGTLFFDIMEIVRAKHPQFIILENVRNLAGPRHRDEWQIILQSLRAEQYEISDAPVVLSPHLIPPDFGGAPQVRDRVFILAERRPGNKKAAVSRPAQIGRRFFRDWDPSRWRIADYLLADANIKSVDDYRLSEEEKTWVEAWDWFVANIECDSLPGFPIWAHAFNVRARVPSDAPSWKRDFLVKNAAFYRQHKDFIDRWLARRWGPSGQTVREFPASRQKFEWQAKKLTASCRRRTLRDLVLQFRPSGIRVKSPTYLPALVAITQTSIVGPAVATGIRDYRRLTPAEAAQLQGIPYRSFRQAGVADRVAYRQLGNAVNVGVVQCAFLALTGDRYVPNKLGTLMAVDDARRPLFRLLQAN